MTILLRILQTTWQNIRRQSLTATTAITVILLLFLLIDGVLFVHNLQAVAISEINSKLDLALSFSEEISESSTTDLTVELRKTFPEIRNVNFVSSEEAYAGFLSNFKKENAGLTEWLLANSTESPLPATLIIQADANFHAEILDFLKNSRYSGILDLDNPATANLASATSKKVVALDQTLTHLISIAIISAIILAILILVSVLRLTIFSRRDEITIMRLVGATRAFVFLPFSLEAIFFTLSACILSAVLFAILLSNFNAENLATGVFGEMSQFFTLAKTDFLANLFLLLGWQIIAAIVIGWLGSALATRKYLGKNISLG